jgi:hypothetical protein
MFPLSLSLNFSNTYIIKKYTGEKIPFSVYFIQNDGIASKCHLIDYEKCSLLD